MVVGNHDQVPKSFPPFFFDLISIRYLDKVHLIRTEYYLDQRSGLKTLCVITHLISSHQHSNNRVRTGSQQIIQISLIPSKLKRSAYVYSYILRKLPSYLGNSLDNKR